MAQHVCMRTTSYKHADTECWLALESQRHPAASTHTSAQLRSLARDPIQHEHPELHRMILSQLLELSLLAVELGILLRTFDLTCAREAEL